MSDPSGGAGPIIIRRAADSPNLTLEQRDFMRDVATALEGGASVDLFTRWQVSRLLGKAVFG
jgi:hypothetical protein